MNKQLNYFLCESFHGQVGIVAKHSGNKPSNFWRIIKDFGSDLAAASFALQAADFERMINSNIQISVPELALTV